MKARRIQRTASRRIFARGRGDSQSVSLLHDARHQSSRLDGNVLQSGRGGLSPDTTHGEPEQGPHREELRERVDKGRSDLKDGDEEEVPDERPLESEKTKGATGVRGGEKEQQSREERKGGRGRSVPLLAIVETKRERENSPFDRIGQPGVRT